jgi:hypothetical protein
MRVHARLAASFITLSIVSSAAAQEASPPAVAAPESTPVSRNRSEDASVDRGFFNSHAETLQKGEIAINSYELVFLGVSGGVTDKLELSLTTLLPIVDEMPVLLMAQGKYAFFRNERTTVSARFNLTYASADSSDSDSETARATAFGGGVAIDHFVDQGGRFAVHGALAINGIAGGIGGSMEVGDGAVIYLEGGATFRAFSSFKLLVDLLLPALIDGDGVDFASVALFTYGMRFHGPNLAADLGFMRPVGDADTSDLVLGLPWVAFTARF